MSLVGVGVTLCLGWRPSTRYEWAVTAAVVVWWQRFVASGWYTLTVLSRPFLASKEAAKPLAGKLFVVTGANSGIGFETAVQIARLGANVVITCRSDAKSQEALLGIAKKADLPRAALAASATGRSLQFLSFVTMELGDLASCVAVPGKLKARCGNDVAIHCLIHNAGAHFGTGQATAQGLEPNVGCNFVGTLAIDDAVRDAKIPVHRTVILASTAHRLAPTTAMVDSVFDKHVTGFDATKGAPSFKKGFTLYGLGKLGNVWHARVLAKEHPGHLVCSVHPGVVYTQFGSDIAAARFLRKIGVFTPIAMLMLKSPCEGAYTSVFCATAPAESRPGACDGVRVGWLHADATPVTPAEVTGPGQDDALAAKYVAWARAIIAEHTAV